MTPREMVTQMKPLLTEWNFDAVSIGFPSPVRDGRILSDPKHLGKGWVGFDFEKALGKPVRVINDAAMQALGSYRGRRMLFLGLGTGLGSALVWAKYVLPLELGDLPYRNGSVIEDYLGKPGLAQLGEKTWQRDVEHALVQLRKSLIADYVAHLRHHVGQLVRLPELESPTTSCWAAATPKNWTNSRKESSAGIIATRFWVESACGKSMRGRADPNGRSFRKETEYYAALLSQTRRSGLARLAEIR
jgi:hypothetical protein